MKTPVYLKAALAGAIFCILAAGNAVANVDQHDLAMMESAKNVGIASQKIAKAYFYKHMDIRPDHAEQDLTESLTDLKRDILRIHEGIKGNSKEEKNIAVFLSYTRDELDRALSKPYSQENGALMIDFSESLLEGADFLSGKYGQAKSGEAGMLAEVENLLFLLEVNRKWHLNERRSGSERLKGGITHEHIEFMEIGMPDNYPVKRYRRLSFRFEESVLGCK